MPTLMIDIRIQPLGRIHLHSGTNDAKILKRMVAMLKELQGQGRLDILRRIKDGRWKVMEVFDRFQANDLESLATTNDLLDFRTVFFEWLEQHEIADKTRENYKQSVTTFLTRMGNTKLINLPKKVAEYRTYCQKLGIATAFNRTRAAISVYIHHTQGRYSELFESVGNVMPLKVKKKVAREPLTPREIEALCAELPLHFADMVKSMAYTGMNWNEYSEGKWVIQGDRIHIKGTKREGRDRYVPLLHFTPVPATRAYQRFQKALARTTKKPTTHNFRHSYKMWLDASGIPMAVVEAYMGHAGAGMAGLYGKQDGGKFLVEDRVKIQTWIDNQLNQPE